ncbi:MAG: tetratricopeptide repeat protein [Burkholderiales bacterium]|nr:tetratricopeptide repeat protein [Anaerolineae bacterium]
MSIINQIRVFIGPARLRALFLLLAGTGILSLVLNGFVDQYEWVRAVQTLLAIGFLIGAALIIGSRLPREERLRWLAIIAPSIGLLALGLTVLPHLLLPLAGGAIGWIIAGLFLFRSKVRMEYQQAVKHLRRSEYEEAVTVMDGLIQREPNNSAHYRFRAELLRLWGKLDRARRDYQRMAEITSDSAVAYNGLAEVLLQMNRYEDAERAAERAYGLAPDDWVAAYNLGMIEDRLATQSKDVIEHLQWALELGVPDVRHRLLIHLYLIRAYTRLAEKEAASAQLEELKRNRDGLSEWQTLLQSEQASALRAALGADVEEAQRLVSGELGLEALAQG